MRTVTAYRSGAPKGLSATDDVQSGEFNTPAQLSKLSGRVLTDSIGPRGRYVTGTSATPAATDGGTIWRYIFAHEDSVINTATSYTDEDSGPVLAGTLTTVAIPKGATWSCALTTFTLTSGKVTAYLE